MKGNRVQLIGYVGNHLDSTICCNGSKRIGIRMATHDNYTNKKGEKVDKTVWHNIVAWDGTAEFAERSFVKGSKIMVEGELDYRVFQKEDGNMMHLARIRAISFMNLDR